MTMAPILVADSLRNSDSSASWVVSYIWERNKGGEALASSVRRREPRQDSVAGVGRHDLTATPYQ